MMTREDKVLHSIRTQIQLAANIHELFPDRLFALEQVVKRIRRTADAYLEQEQVLSGATPSDEEEAAQALDGE